MSNKPTIVPAVITPPSAAIGLPSGVKETGQTVDFRTDPIQVAIEHHGYRLAWSRAAVCPCEPLNSETEQSDPNCKLCGGTGLLYFGSTQGNDYNKVGTLTDAQAQIIKESNATVIRGLMTSIQKDTRPWEKIGAAQMGTANVTVQPANRLGYYDRLVSLDSTIVFQEMVKVPTDPTLPLPTRYLVDGGVNLCQSLTTSYKGGADFNIVNGRVFFVKGRRPTPGTRISMHYQTHPVWLVMDVPHAVRGSNIAAKKPNPTTPEGDYTELALQATLKLEFLVKKATPTVGDASLVGNAFTGA